MTPEPPPTLADRIDAALPQTQCTRCGYADCRAYANAVAEGQAGINQCPPGGAEGVSRLAAISGRPLRPLSPEFGVEGPRRVMFVDESRCIGCTLCIKACPVDCIVGAPKRMHTVIEPLCTGCELCLPACPVDCIEVEIATPLKTGWGAWSDSDAQRSRERYARHLRRLDREALEAAPQAPAPDARQAAVEAALRRARERAAAARS